MNTIHRVIIDKVIADLCSFIKKYYNQTEHASIMKELGYEIEQTLNGSHSDSAPSDNFKSALANTFSYFTGTVETADNENNSVSIKISSPYFCENPEFFAPFLKGIVLAAGAQSFEICSIKEESFNDGSFYITAVFADADTQDKLKAEELILQERNLFNAVTEKITSLQKRINALETSSSDKKKKQEKLSDITLFKLNQELEKTNIELKTQNAILAEKNTEMAFELMDLEEKLVNFQNSIDSFEKQTMENVIKAEEEEDIVKKKNVELENKLKQQETYLEISRHELQIKIAELEEANKKAEEALLAKETLSIEVINLKKINKRDEDVIKNLEKDKEGLIEQIRQLEDLNEHLQEDFMTRMNKLVRNKQEDAQEFSKGSFAERVYKILYRFTGESAEFLVKKALERINVSEEDINSSDLETKKKFINRVLKGAKRLVESKEDYSAVSQELTKIVR